MIALKVGDPVILNSGSFPMTIDEITNDETAMCIWHNTNGMLQREEYPLITLKRFSLITDTKLIRDIYG